MTSIHSLYYLNFKKLTERVCLLFAFVTTVVNNKFLYFLYFKHTMKKCDKDCIYLSTTVLI